MKIQGLPPKDSAERFVSAAKEAETVSSETTETVVPSYDVLIIKSLPKSSSAT